MFISYLHVTLINRERGILCIIVLLFDEIFQSDGFGHLHSEPKTESMSPT